MIGDVHRLLGRVIAGEVVAVRLLLWCCLVSSSVAVVSRSGPESHTVDAGWSE